MRWRTVSAFKHAGRTMLVKRLGADEGPHFVLVHGIGVASAYYRRLARALAPHGAVHAVELPGHGGAPKPAEPMSIEDYAGVVSAYVIQQGLVDPILVGQSMGTQVVTEAALQHPNLFRRVVLIGAVVNPRERSALHQGLRLLQDCMFFETPTSNWVVLRDYVRTGVRWYAATLPAMLGYHTEDALRRLTAETLVIRGGRDPISRHDWNLQMRRLIPLARFVEIPRKGHVVMYSAPEAVLAPILELAGLAATDAAAR
ncbi:alpha/beta fold hydrolase [Naasia aerilata]|uniref:Alpha/beta hydrolase n=1 Tax=Naasia aerilata TaxID=1162966 RepID=A0ABM8GGZ1_9MICO|nr:alpha/beta hydrolase [Naasia aerilata]BDZ47624.1 alpha/beta hydrolase [Naasia aerilata]